MRTIITVILLLFLSGCTVAGALIDGRAESSARDAQIINNQSGSEPNKNPLTPTPSDSNGFSFADVGLKIDSALVNLVKGKSTTTQVCRQITKSLKECVEVENSTLHTNEPKQIKTDDEIISVGQ